MHLDGLNQLLPFINTALIASVAVSMIAALRRNRGKSGLFTASLTALQDEIAAIRDQVARLDANSERLCHTIETIRGALRQRSRGGQTGKAARQAEVRSAEQDLAS